MDTNKIRNDPWPVISYEVSMYWGTRNVIHAVSNLADGDVIKNAVVESLVLHTRILIEFLLSKGNRDDDIRLKDLLPNWVDRDGKEILQKLRDAYGNSTKEDSPCWIINKKLAHPTTHRTSEFNYSDTLNKIDPIVSGILQQLSIRTRKVDLFPYHIIPKKYLDGES